MGKWRNVVSGVCMIIGASARRAAANVSGRIARTGWTVTAAPWEMIAKYSNLKC